MHDVFMSHAAGDGDIARRISVCPGAAIEGNEKDVQATLDAVAAAGRPPAKVRRLPVKRISPHKSSQMDEGPSPGEDGVAALSMEAVFREDIEEGGAYIGDVEDRVSAKARKRCADVLARCRAVLFARCGQRGMEADGLGLTFDGGRIDCAAERTWGSSFDVRYTITTRVCLYRQWLVTLDALVAKLGAYKELAYQLSRCFSLDEIASGNKALLDNLDSLDLRRMTYMVDDITLAICSEPEGSRISITHKYCGLNKRLHHVVTQDVLLAWLLGKDSGLPMESVQLVE